MTPHRHAARTQALTSGRNQALAARPRRLAAGLLLIAALVAGCGSGDTASLDTSPVATPASGADATAEAEIPAAPTEPASQPPYEAPDGSETEVEPESDAGRWVDRRQDDVLNEVHDNNMEATEAWTP